MPKIITESKERRLSRWGVIEDWKSQHEANTLKLAALWGIAAGSITNKKKDPGSITIEQVRLLDLPDEQIIRIVKGR